MLTHKSSACESISNYVESQWVIPLLNSLGNILIDDVINNNISVAIVLTDKRYQISKCTLKLLKRSVCFYHSYNEVEQPNVFVFEALSEATFGANSR